VRILIVAAHPDDETIGASALLGANAGATVLHVTDGAPCDPRWRPPAVAELPAYARVRACEADRALRHVRAHSIGPLVPDQRAVYELARIAESSSLARPI
jgi:LmbE family N-acetylglucosaminyl deacetylase